MNKKISQLGLNVFGEKNSIKFKGSCLAITLTAIGVVFCVIYGVFLLVKMESGELDTYSSYNIEGT